MQKRSDLMTKGPERAPHRSLLRADGYSDWEMDRPIIGIANSFNEIIPGHIYLDKLVEAVKAGENQTGDKCGHEKLAHRNFCHRPVKNQHNTGRNEDAQGTTSTY